MKIKILKIEEGSFFTGRKSFHLKEGKIYELENGIINRLYHSKGIDKNGYLIGFCNKVKAEVVEGD